LGTRDPAGTSFRRDKRIKELKEPNDQLSSAYCTNADEVADVVVDANATAEIDDPRLRSDRFVGGPDPPLIFIEHGLDIQTTVLGLRLHQGHALF